MPLVIHLYSPDSCWMASWLLCGQNGLKVFHATCHLAGSIECPMATMSVALPSLWLVARWIWNDMPNDISKWRLAHVFFRIENKSIRMNSHGFRGNGDIEAIPHWRLWLVHLTESASSYNRAGIRLTTTIEHTFLCMSWYPWSSSNVFVLFFSVVFCLPNEI